MADRYPRDLRGYGRTPPDPRWPGGARVAVQFVVNFEEGGENNILHGDRASEAFLSDVLGAKPWPGQRHANIESMFEYGSRAGFWRLWRMFNERKLPATVFGVATALQRNPEVVAAMKEADWDIASHSLKWVEHKDMSEAEEREEIANAIRVHTEATGSRPLGWYTGRTSINTVRLVMEAGGFLYSCDSYADDLPYWIKGPNGAASDHSLQPRCQRHALRQRAGVWRRRSVLHLSQGLVRRAVCRRRNLAEDDVGGAALPRRRPSRARGGADAVSRLHHEP